jgi:hypothetical protein
MNFKASKSPGEENVIRLHILYTNPLKDEITEAKFRLISINGLSQPRAGKGYH